MKNKQLLLFLVLWIPLLKHVCKLVKFYWFYNKDKLWFIGEGFKIKHWLQLWQYGDLFCYDGWESHNLQGNISSLWISFVFCVGYFLLLSYQCTFSGKFVWEILFHLRYNYKMNFIVHVLFRAVVCCFSSQGFFFKTLVLNLTNLLFYW